MLIWSLSPGDATPTGEHPVTPNVAINVQPVGEVIRDPLDRATRFEHAQRMFAPAIRDHSASFEWLPADPPDLGSNIQYLIETRRSIEQYVRR